MSKFAKELEKELLLEQLAKILADARTAQPRLGKRPTSVTPTVDLASANTAALQHEGAVLADSAEVQQLVEIMQKNPPEVLVFASNSMRKAIMFYWILCGGYDIQHWPAFAPEVGFDPQEMQTAESVHHLFEARIHNGDGAVREPFLIGYLPNGVPFILCPTDGETSGNEHTREATNKVQSILEFFKDVDALILGLAQLTF